MVQLATGCTGISRVLIPMMKEQGTKKSGSCPHTGGNLSYASAELETGYGKLSVYWKVNNGNFSMDVEIPVQYHSFHFYSGINC